MNVEPPGLRGSSVCLRAITSADLERLRAFINDPDVLAYSNVYKPITDVQQAAWFASASGASNQVWFAIDRLGAQPSLIGTCCLVDIEWIGRVAELRIRIGDKQAWGKQLGSQACAMLVDYGFRTLNLERIWLRVFAPNAAALRMYEKLGFVTEGRLRRAWHFQGVTDDVVVMGLLRSEWKTPAKKPVKKSRR